MNEAGITQLAECQPPMLNVAGSTPVARSITPGTSLRSQAADALQIQLHSGALYRHLLLDRLL